MPARVPSQDGFGLPGLDPGLEADLARGMADVEALLRASLRSDLTFLADTSRHLLDAGGKRFRPLLVLLAAEFGHPRAPGVVPAAAVVELTHLATLYHDDVQDEASLRRGAPSANALWDNTIAILTGDFLFATASEILADLGTEAVRIQAQTFQRLVTGQIREAIGPRGGEDPVEHYLSVLADKTGSLIATSGRLGGLLAGADPATVSVLARFGERVGLVFQLADDLLDVDGDWQRSGKVPGTDLREHVPTLPVLLLRRGADPTDPGDSRLLDLLDGDLSDDAVLAEALERLRGHRAMDEARAELVRVAGEARAVLAALPDGPARSALEALCDATASRSV